jgi:hypothetical protein
MAEDSGAFKTIPAESARTRHFVIAFPSLHGSLTAQKKYFRVAAAPVEALDLTNWIERLR